MTPSVVTTGSARLATHLDAAIIAALRDPACYPHPVARIEVLETHISWVILTGRYAYKLKKPVNLGFLDFSTLEARRHYCEEELRLNRRSAPSLYETVVKITGSANNPRIGGDGAAIEYAVKMREFPQSALASRLLEAGALTAAHIDALATRIAAFHAQTGVAACGCPDGSPEAVIAPAHDNFTALATLLPDAADQARICALRIWTDQEFHARWTRFGARQTAGHVRECHGDLHLGNIVMLDGELTPFDCIEFNPALRWIDVMSEVAFLVMDLIDCGRTDFANRFLNAYLEAGGGYEGLDLLHFYWVYRALVRAKVHALRAAQDGIAAAERARLLGASRDYLELAQDCTGGGGSTTSNTSKSYVTRPPIILMHGVSGSGKSVIAQALAEYTGAIRLRSDVERKRLCGLAAHARSCIVTSARSGIVTSARSSIVTPTRSSFAPPAPDAGIYAAELTLATYQRLLDLARGVINAGYAAVVDATFLKGWQRELFRRYANAKGIPFVIIDVTAPEAVLRARIAARLAAGNDASEADQAVLTQQLAHNDALTAEESSAVLRFDTARTDAEATLMATCAALRARLAA